jgi:hypothetical protein
MKLEHLAIDRMARGARRAMRRAALSALAAFSMISSAAAGDGPAMLVHRFTIEQPDEWVTIEVQPTAALWHQRIAGGPTARFDDVRAVLGSLKSIAIGARCPGRTEGPVHYPCAFDVDVRQHDGTIGALETWISTTTYKLMQPGEGIVSALSTPRPEPGSITVAGEAGWLALVAPVALQAELAEGRPLRMRVRVRPAPVADEGDLADAKAKARATTGSTQGVIVLGTQPLRPQPRVPAGNGAHRV